MISKWRESPFPGNEGAKFEPLDGAYRSRSSFLPKSLFLTSVRGRITGISVYVLEWTKTSEKKETHRYLCHISVSTYIYVLNHQSAQSAIMKRTSTLIPVIPPLAQITKVFFIPCFQCFLFLQGQSFPNFNLQKQLFYGST